MGRQATVCTLFPPQAEVTLVWRTETPPCIPTLFSPASGKSLVFPFFGRREKQFANFASGGDRLPRQTKTEVSRTVVTRISAGKLQISSSRCRKGPSPREILPTSVLEQFNDLYASIGRRFRDSSEIGARIENGFGMY